MTDSRTKTQRTFCIAAFSASAGADGPKLMAVLADGEIETAEND